jgi:hypothetical protein
MTLNLVHKHAEKTLMPASNLALMLAPNFLRGDDALVDLNMCAIQPGSLGMLLKYWIEEYDQVKA